MHTGVISFCDRVGYNIKSSDTKESILRELNGKFQIQILQKHWHKLDPEGVTHLYRSPHFACLRSNGNPYYMYFTRYEDVPIIYFIDKKIQPGYQVPRVILGRGKWGDEVFNQTLIEGEMVKDKYNGWVFLINDVVAFQGEYLWRLTLPQRLEYGYRLLQDYYQPDPLMDVCMFHMKKYAHATQEGITALLELSKELPYTSRGLYFWPFSRKFKPKLYNFDDSLIKAVTRKVKDNPEFREAHIPIPSVTRDSASSSDESAVTNILPVVANIPHNHQSFTNVSDGDRVLWLRKTENPDVYDIYPSSQMTSQKEGVAHVPSLKVSKLLRAEFKDATVAVAIPFVCRYDEKWQKWLPMKKAIMGESE